MTNPDLFEEMLTTYPAEKRELARQVYHRFAEGDSTQFFVASYFLLLDVYAHYAERIPARMISANADSLATMQEIREEIGMLAKTIEILAMSASPTMPKKRTSFAGSHWPNATQPLLAIELTVKNLGAQVDTKAIVRGINAALESGIRRQVIEPFIQRTEELASTVMPTLESIRRASAEATCEWSERIWNTAWTTSLVWSMGAAR